MVSHKKSVKTGKKKVNVAKSFKTVKTKSSKINSKTKSKTNSKTKISKSNISKNKSSNNSKIEKIEKNNSEGTIIDKYTYMSKDIPINITIQKLKGEFVPTYEVSISSISRTTEFLLERIRHELIKKVNLGIADITDSKNAELIEQKFSETINDLIKKYFPDADDETIGFLTSYLIAKSLGLGNIQLLMDDDLLEELVINQATEPVWVYHKKHGWLKTNIFLRDEEQTKHYSSIVARKVGRQISVLEPLLDAHLDEGDRVNATLSPISTAGNTITIRKFSRDPWTITKLIDSNTISAEAAAWIWMAMHYEMSAIIAGGTASGKTSAMNCLANFFPPNQRIISIEDTREIRLPKFLHWVPMNTRLPNAEGKGEITMGNLLVNSLRMRPDRILVGEVRRKQEAETLFEAIHTGHSVYATFHANNAQEAIERLTNRPIEVPPIMLPAISLIIVQFRNRRTGNRRTFQIAEILPNAEPNVILQYDNKKDKLILKNKSKSFMTNLRLYTGYSDTEIRNEINEKRKVLEYMVKFKIRDVDPVGRIIAEYYTNKKELMKFVNSNKLFKLND